MQHKRHVCVGKSVCVSACVPLVVCGEGCEKRQACVAVQPIFGSCASAVAVIWKCCPAHSPLLQQLCCTLAVWLCSAARSMCIRCP